MKRGKERGTIYIYREKDRRKEREREGDRQN